MHSLKQIRVPSLWQLGLSGEGVKIGVVGTGVDLYHPDLQGHQIEGFSVTPDGQVSDNVGHETGIVWLISRIAPRAHIIVGKDRNNTLGAYQWVIQALERLRTLGVQVINLSFATDFPTDGTDPLSREVSYLVQSGIIVVCAAGNHGPHYQTIGAPGAAALALTVGKVNDRDLIWSDSSRGPTIDGRLKPDCVAPGVKIIAAIPTHFRRGSYAYFDCTSYATPHVSGLVALLLQAYPDRDPTTIKNAIMTGCDQVFPPLMSRVAGSFSRRVVTGLGLRIAAPGDPRWSVGAGRVNGYRSYEWLKNGSKKS